jgi:RimJ/RimL family protein N-acetyltransferase
LTAADLAFLTDIDHHHHEALAAIDQRDGSIAGVSRYVRHPDRPDAAELAAEVADELQGMGVGTWLAMRTAQRARENGYTFLTATTLWENLAARAILRHLGFRNQARGGAALEYQLRMAPPIHQSTRRYANGRPDHRPVCA